MSNARKYDGVIKTIEDESQLHRKDGIHYLKDSIGKNVRMTLNGALLNESKLTHVENDFYSNNILIKFENERIEKIPIIKGTVEFDEDMEFPMVYFDYREKNIKDDFLNTKDDEKSMEIFDFKLRHGGLKKKLREAGIGRFDQAIVAFEILDNTKEKLN